MFVTIHGTEGSSPRVKLPSRPEDFLRGNQDTFRVQLKALGEIGRLTVGHNNRGQNPAWHLDRAEVTDEASGELRHVRMFECPFACATFRLDKCAVCCKMTA